VGTILIADDDRTCLDSIQKVLEREGYQVEAAQHADGALQALRTRRFDLVVCDYRMPGKTGIDLLQEIKREGWNVPVVIITAHVDAATEANALQLGAIHLMKKPIRRQALLDLAARICGAETICPA
jgi:two-component system, NtrC family, response regulator HydG